MTAPQSPPTSGAPSERALRAFAESYDADEDCQDGEGVYCSRCVKRALAAAYAVDFPVVALSAEPSEAAESAKKAVSAVLHRITQRDPEMWLDDTYIRWGRVEKEIHAVVEAALAARPAAGPEPTPEQRATFEEVGAAMREAGFPAAGSETREQIARDFGDEHSNRWYQGYAAGLEYARRSLAAVPPSPDATTGEP
jgi:hypothetical protein